MLVEELYQSSVSLSKSETCYAI